MDNLFINQTEIYESMNKLFINFKKDGADRKTLDFCKRRLELLETYWRDYLSNHNKLCEFADFDHVYFQKRCYDTAENTYLKVKEAISLTMERLEKQGQQPLREGKPGVELLPQPGTSRPITPSPQPEMSHEAAQRPFTLSAEDGDPRKLNQLLKKQTIQLKAFMRTVSSITTSHLEKRWEYEDALRALESRWRNIDELHWQIEGENGDENLQYQEEFSKHELVYNNLKKNINTKMFSESHREKSTPQMDIPVFSGNYHQWVSFKDLFNETIHKNMSMSSAQKMQFLKSRVTGDAERLIHHLQISSDNYDVCWDILNHRYDNKKLIFTSHINAMLGIPNLPHQSAALIKKLHDVTKESLHAIQNLGVDISSWDPLLVHLLGQKLDSESFAEYVESVKNPRELPILQEFLSFLECKFTALEASRRKQEHFNQPKTNVPYNSRTNLPPNHKKPYHPTNNNYHSNHRYNTSNLKPNMNTFHVSRSITCVLCNADHGLWQCSKFLQMSNGQKLITVNQFNLCRNCLTNHYNKSCFSNKRCRKCLGTHNTLMHEALLKQKPVSVPPKSNVPKSPKNMSIDEPGSSSSHVSWNDMSEILLATAMVKVTGVDGTQHTMRALIDQGSQISLINETTAQTLGLKRNHCRGTIFGVGEKENQCKGMMNIEVKSMYNEFSVKTNVFIMNNLIKSLPNKTFVKPEWTHIQNISLADPKFNESRPIDLLFGVDIYSKIMLGGILRGDNEELPIAQQSQFGWLLCGSVKPFYRCNVVLQNTDDLRKFWENEDINQTIEMSSEDNDCLEYFLSTTRRIDGYHKTYKSRRGHYYRPQLYSERKRFCTVLLTTASQSMRMQSNDKDTADEGHDTQSSEESSSNRPQEERRKAGAPGEDNKRPRRAGTKK